MKRQKYTYTLIINQGLDSEISKDFSTQKECKDFVKSLREKEYSQTLNNGIKIKTWSILGNKI